MPLYLALFAVLLGLAAVGPAGAQSLPAGAGPFHVSGKAGYLSEWDLEATVTHGASDAAGSYAGPLTLTHTGLCTVNDPTVKPGSIALEIFGTPGLLRASLRTADGACTARGRWNGTFRGVMDCPHARGIPLSLSLGKSSSGKPSLGGSEAR